MGTQVVDVVIRITAQTAAGASQLKQFGGNLKSAVQQATGLNVSLQTVDKSMQNANASAGKLTSTFRQLAQLATVYYFFRSVSSAILDSTKRVIDFITAANALGQLLGLTAQQASAFVYQAQQMGVSVDTVTEAYRTFADRLGRATGLFGEQNRGSRQMAAAMKELGIQMTDSSGRVRSMGEIIPEVADAMQKLGPGIKTAAIATALFGQRSDELLPLLLKGSEGLQKAADTANKLGFALTTIETQQLRDATFALNDMQKSFDAVLLTISKGLAPALPGLAETFVNVAAAIDKAFVIATSKIILTTAVVLTAIKEADVAIRNLQRSIGIRGGAIEAGPGTAGISQALLEIMKFLAGRGYSFDPRTGEITKLPGQGAGTSPPLFPGAGDEDTGLQSSTDRRRDLIIKFATDTFRLIRDYNIDQTREEANFNRELAQQQDDFWRDRLQKQADFYSKQAERTRDFDREQSQRLEDFNRSQADNQQDYDIDRARLIEDSIINEQEQTRRNADERIRLEERLQQKIADLREKWDEILLRLQVGGDRDSIILAQEKYAQVLSEQEQSNQDELSQLDQQQQEEQQRHNDELALRLRRLDEDFRLEQERKQRDFNTDQQRRQDEFNMEQEDRRREFALDQQRELDEFITKMNRRVLEYHLKRQQEQEDFRLKMQDRAEDFTRELNDLNSQIYAKLAVLGQGYAQEEEQAREHGRNMIDIARETLERINQMNGEIGGAGGGYRRAFGGGVPGPLGAPVPIIAHGGERIVPPATSGYYSNVRQGDQFSINAPITISNSIGRGDPALISAMLSRALSRTHRIRRAFVG